jgi:hypothetical protein
MLQPPSCKWASRPGCYAAFVSHFKVEAGSDARYLKDLLERMLGARVYLDSVDLVDLETLVDGVHASDCVVLLGTPGVLTRPWCIVELYSAHARGIPVVLLQIARRELDLDDAARLIDDLETELDRRNPNAFAEVTRRLSGAPLDEVKAALRSVLHLDTAHAPGHRPLVFHPHGTDNALIADATDLVDAMAEATSRQLRWSELSTQLSSPGSTRERTVRFAVSLRRRPRRAAFDAGDYSFFLCHYRDEAGCHARLLQLKLIEKLERPVYLDATDADDITRIISEGVAHCECLLLLQTKGILHRPFCLLEILEAVRLGIPIVPIAIEGCGYDFDAARALCEGTPAELRAKLEAASPGALAAVARRLTPPVSIDQASRLLATALATIPPIIAVSFDPAASENHLLAVVRDIREKKERVVSHAGSTRGQQRVKERQKALATARQSSMRRISIMGRRGSGTSTKGMAIV